MSEVLPSIGIDGVSYRFGWRGVVAVNRVSAILNGPGIYGLLGPNGAGKTSLMRMLAGVVPPDEGSCHLNGVDLQSAARRQVLAVTGYLPQESPMVPSLTVGDFLHYVAWLKNLDPPEVDDAVRRVASQFELSDLMKRRMGRLSGGERRRTGLAQAFVNNPRIAILDEPTAGLDPYHRTRFREFVTSAGRTALILLSTHLVEDIASTCREVLIMMKGELRLFSALSDLSPAGSAPPTAAEIETVYLGLREP